MDMKFKNNTVLDLDYAELEYNKQDECIDIEDVKISTPKHKHEMHEDFFNIITEDEHTSKNATQTEINEDIKIKEDINFNKNIEKDIKIIIDKLVNDSIDNKIREKLNKIKEELKGIIAKIDGMKI